MFNNGEGPAMLVWSKGLSRPPGEGGRAMAASFGTSDTVGVVGMALAFFGARLAHIGASRAQEH